MYVIHSVTCNSPCACIHVHIELYCLYIHGYIVFTGQRICRLEENCEVGNGTYSRNGYVYSSLAGYLQTSGGEDGKVVLSSHNYIHPMFQLIQLLTGFEDNKSFVWPENGSVARSHRPRTTDQFKGQQSCCCPRSQSITVLLYTFIFSKNYIHSFHSHNH